MKRMMIAAVAGAVLCLAGCGRTELDILPGEGSVRITVNCGEQGTRGTVEGVGNDNLIKSVDYFLFNTAANGASCLHGRIEPDVVSTEYTFYIPTNNIPTNQTYTVYTVVNFPESRKAELEVSGITLEAINAIVLDENTDATFTAHYTQGSGENVRHRYPAAGEEASLVMTGGTASSFELATVSDKITQAIDLTRLPAKVTMEFYVKDEVVLEHDAVRETWTPMTDGDNVRVYLCNALKSASLGDVTPPSTVTASEFFDYEPSLNSTSKSGKSGYSKAFDSEAFYSYPRTWEAGAADEPYLKLIIPWKVRRVEDGRTTESQKELYYKVMLPSALGSFERNHWYRLVLDVDRVGSDMEEAAVELTCAYVVADWGDPQGFTSDLVRGYYLDVNEGNHDLAFFGDNVEIPYFASGEVEYEVIRAWMNDYQTNAEVPLEATDYAVANNKDDAYISISHELHSNYNTSNYDVSPFYYEIKLKLVGQEGVYDKTLVVTQYPPLYLKQERSGVYNGNSSTVSGDPVFLNGRSYRTLNGVAGVGNGNLYDNPNTYSPGTGLSANNSSNKNWNHFIGTITNPTSISGEGASTNQYIFEVNATILQGFTLEVGSETVEAVIGDPRVGEEKAYRLPGSNTDFDFNIPGLPNPGQADGYRPTANNTQNVISPKFIVASSFGKTDPMTYEGAMRRCAAYQEFGYPAGRWRLPTMAEIQFLIRLYGDQKIKQLFQQDSACGYWAGGEMALFGSQNGDWFEDMYLHRGSYVFGDVVDDDNQRASDVIANSFDHNGVTKNRGVWTRCVYDTWYWGNDKAVDFDPSSPSWQGFQTAAPSTH